MNEANDIHWNTHISPPPIAERVWTIAIGLGIVSIVVAYFTHDFLFTTILILAAVVLILNLTRPHHQNQITIHATGVSIDETRHHYADMKSFWIDYEPQLNIKDLSIEFKKGFTPPIRIPLEETNPLEIRQAMVSYVPEKAHERSLLDTILRDIGI